jgi:ABC-type spermidine/putrescine transport system permease subunit I
MLQIMRTADFPMASVMSLLLMLLIIGIYAVFHRHLKMDRL